MKKVKLLFRVLKHSIIGTIFLYMWGIQQQSGMFIPFSSFLTEARWWRRSLLLQETSWLSQRLLWWLSWADQWSGCWSFPLLLEIRFHLALIRVSCLSSQYVWLGWHSEKEEKHCFRWSGLTTWANLNIAVCWITFRLSAWTLTFMIYLPPALLMGCSQSC